MGRKRFVLLVGVALLAIFLLACFPGTKEDTQVSRMYAQADRDYAAATREAAEAARVLAMAGARATVEAAEVEAASTRYFVEEAREKLEVEIQATKVRAEAEAQAIIKAANVQAQATLSAAEAGAQATVEAAVARAHATTQAVDAEADIDRDEAAREGAAQEAWASHQRTQQNILMAMVLIVLLLSVWAVQEFIERRRVLEDQERTISLGFFREFLHVELSKLTDLLHVKRE